MFRYIKPFAVFLFSFLFICLIFLKFVLLYNVMVMNYAENVREFIMVFDFNSQYQPIELAISLFSCMFFFSSLFLIMLMIFVYRMSKPEIIDWTMWEVILVFLVVILFVLLALCMFAYYNPITVEVVGVCAGECCKTVKVTNFEDEMVKFMKDELFNKPPKSK